MSSPAASRWPEQSLVLTSAPAEILFSPDSKVLGPSHAGTELVHDAGRTEVGLLIDSGHLEDRF